MKAVLCTFLCLLFVACAGGGTDDKMVWRASADNGDKPGIGIELTKVASVITAAYYVMSPDAPEEFGLARKCPASIRAISETELVMEVEFAPDNRLSLRVLLQRPLAKDRVPAAVQDAAGQGRIIEMVFVRAAK